LCRPDALHHRRADLIDFGVPNPVYALENGTQGWFLAGLTLEHGASRRYGDKVTSANAAELGARARKLAVVHAVEFVAAAEANAWLADASRTAYLLDVRTPEEFAAHAVPGFTRRAAS
jgi:3-mercaptopyruvate sulfurtransferase SseA